VLDSLVSTTPVSLDELTRACGAPVAAVSAALMELSMAGRVELLPGGGAVRA
jgi:DNA processing protein